MDVFKYKLILKELLEWIEKSFYERIVFENYHLLRLINYFLKFNSIKILNFVYFKMHDLILCIYFL